MPSTIASSNRVITLLNAYRNQNQMATATTKIVAVATCPALHVWLLRFRLLFIWIGSVYRSRDSISNKGFPYLTVRDFPTRNRWDIGYLIHGVYPTSLLFGEVLHPK